MATAKKTTKKTAVLKPMSRVEYRKFFRNISAARVLARKISQDKSRDQHVRIAMRSIENKLWKIGNDYRWGIIAPEQ